MASLSLLFISDCGYREIEGVDKRDWNDVDGSSNIIEMVLISFKQW